MLDNAIIKLWPIFVRRVAIAAITSLGLAHVDGRIFILKVGIER